jgi:hypothetical protein
MEADLPKKALKNCVTADWEGMYVLAVGNKIYLMDYDSYGFSAISSYTKNDDAQLHLPWWIWESHNTINDMVSIGGELIVFSILPSSLGIFAFKGDYDEIIGTNGAERKEIHTIAQTKAFDFGSGTEKKSVPRVEMLLGKMNVSPINATILTESGNEEHLIEFTETEADERSLRCFSGKVIRPINQNSYRMAIRFESEGNMFLESISLPFKFIGGIE